MNKQCLVLSLEVVAQDHEEAELLVERVWLRHAIDLFLEYDKYQTNDDWTSVLYEEHSSPRDLPSEVFEDKRYLIRTQFFLSEKVLNFLAFVC